MLSLSTTIRQVQPPAQVWLPVALSILPVPGVWLHCDICVPGATCSQRGHQPSSGYSLAANQHQA